MQAVNWNTAITTANTFWDQNMLQFWTPDEFNVGQDLITWAELNKDEKDVYVKVLAGLTGLDTLQANVGMPTLQRKTQDLKSKAVMSFMGTMEQIHAMSYSHIFTTLISNRETEYLLSSWVPENKWLNQKEDTIKYFYSEAMRTGSSSHWARLYMGYVTSVLLESFLFYSGFYYPLHLAGQGKMTGSGEVIGKIIMDESIHGAFIGLLAQETLPKIEAPANEGDEDYKLLVEEELRQLLADLTRIEDKYIEELYEPVGLVDEVKNFTRYNANKALQILGRESIYKVEPVSAVVLNGLNTETRTHDFFSAKGNGYIKTKNVEELSDDDFDF